MIRARTLVAIVLGEMLGLYAANALAANPHVTLHGKLFLGDGECHFFLDPEGESETIELTANPGGAMCDYLTGTNTRNVVITIGPE